MAYDIGSRYLATVPRYIFAGVDSEQLLVSRIRNLVSARASPIIADCGAGPAAIWDHVEHQGRVLAIEPDKSMWSMPPSPRVEYVKTDGLRFMLTFAGELDLIVWLWSLNYALSSFFEQIDPQTGEITRMPMARADAECRATLLSALRRWRATPIFLTYFDSESCEQQFVTHVWCELAGFPFDDRGHTRKVLEWALDVEQTRGASVSRQHLVGSAGFGPVAGAPERFSRFHFRHAPRAAQAQIRREVEDFCAAHDQGGIVHVPAGVWIYEITP